MSATPMTNAQAMVSAYREAGGAGYFEPLQTTVEDMVADLRLYAHDHGLDWIKIVDLADIHFEETNDA